MLVRKPMGAFFKLVYLTTWAILIVFNLVLLLQQHFGNLSHSNSINLSELSLSLSASQEHKHITPHNYHSQSNTQLQILINPFLQKIIYKRFSIIRQQQFQKTRFFRMGFACATCNSLYSQLAAWQVLRQSFIPTKGQDLRHKYQVVNPKSIKLL